MKKDVTIHIHSPKHKDEVKPVTNLLTPSNFYGKYKPMKQKDVTPSNFYGKYRPRKQILTKHPFEYNMEILNK